MLLGLDLGTTNIKAVVTELDGRVLARGSAPVQLFHTAAGGIEQDINEIWTAALLAIAQATKLVDASGIRAIGVSSQGGAMQVLDDQGQPVGRVISWLDSRGSADDEALTARLGRAWFIERIGHGRSGLAIGQLLRLGRQQPGLRQTDYRVGFVGDSVVGRLCGRAAHDGTSCGLTLLYNPNRRIVDPDLLEQLGLSERQLPDLLSPRHAAGGLVPETARQTGLRAGIPVAPAVHDQYAAALGSGAVHVGDVMFGAGTAWILLAVMDRLTEPVIDEAFVCTHLVDSLYGQILSLYNGGSSLTWALNLLGLANCSNDHIQQLIESVPPGSEGLCFWPFLAAFTAAGLVPGTKGRLSGLQFSHTPAHVIRAVIEALACELNRHLLFLRRAAIPVQRLLMCGGAATSQTTPQIIADVTGLPIACQTNSEASVLGAAIIARGLIEKQASLSDLAAEMAPPARWIEPGANASFYQKQCEKYLLSLPLINPSPFI
jgi:xylulokinase